MSNDNELTPAVKKIRRANEFTSKKSGIIDWNSLSKARAKKKVFYGIYGGVVLAIAGAIGVVSEPTANNLINPYNGEAVVEYNRLQQQIPEIKSSISILEEKVELPHQPEHLKDEVQEAFSNSKLDNLASLYHQELAMTEEKIAVAEAENPVKGYNAWKDKLSKRTRNAFYLGLLVSFVSALAGGVTEAAYDAKKIKTINRLREEYTDVPTTI